MSEAAYLLGFPLAVSLLLVPLRRRHVAFWWLFYGLVSLVPLILPRGAGVQDSGIADLLTEMSQGLLDERVRGVQADSEEIFDNWASPHDHPLALCAQNHTKGANQG
jgi:4-amino-4-deoxy-L-arabinose transferase-like glycosyltransferase